MVFRDGRQSDFAKTCLDSSLHVILYFKMFLSLFAPYPDLPHHRPKPLYVPVTRNNESTFCTRDQYLAPRVAFITWLVTFFLEKKYVNSAAVAQSAKNGTEVIPKLIQVKMTDDSLMFRFQTVNVGFESHSKGF